jgi:hypothetical protein
MGLALCWLCGFLASPSGVGLAAGISFSGSLERVGSGSLSVRLTDRRVIDAMLPKTAALNAAALVSQYHWGDQVEVTCEPIKPVWEEGTARYQSLEVTALRLIRRPSAEEVSSWVSAAPFREGKNLLKLPERAEASRVKPPDWNAPGGGELARARSVSLAYAANMPNFVADEKARRFRIGPGSSTWRDYDTVESEITFRGDHVARERIRRDGIAVNGPFESLPGFKWSEGFGSEIAPLFDPKCPTTIEFQKRSKVGGRPVLEYRFRTPADSCFPYFFFEYQRYNPARTGHIAIEEATGNLLQLDEEANAFPAEIQFATREEHISWDYVKIGGESHLLPVRANFLVRYYDGTNYRIEVEYKNHRHFETSTSVSFH